MEQVTPALMLTVAGAAGVVLILLQAIWKAVGSAIDKDRFGPLIALLVGVVVVEAFAITQGADLGQGFLTGLLAGATAMALHDAGDSVGLPV